MKKISLFLVLILMGAMWSNVDARWIIGSRKTAANIKPGDTIVIEQSSNKTYKGYYIQATSSAKGVELLKGTVTDIGDEAIIVVEEGPLKMFMACAQRFKKVILKNNYQSSEIEKDNEGKFKVTSNEN